MAADRTYGAEAKFNSHQNWHGNIRVKNLGLLSFGNFFVERKNNNTFSFPLDGKN
jgi:hypothetical protein